MNLIVILIVIVSLLLMLVILAQNSKGGGLSSQFGGSGTSQLMGVKRTGDLLEKITWGLAIALLALTLSTSFFIDGTREGGVVSPNIQRAQEQQTVVPGLGGTELEEGAPAGEATEGTEENLDTGVELDAPAEEAEAE